LGYACNARCVFCYYQGHLKTNNNLTTGKAKKWLKFFHAQGMEAIDFTGGEPTIRTDIGELIAYARELGYGSISIITNGIRTHDRKFLGELVACGLNDILFSLHGHNAAIHDGLTGISGSFDKVVASIVNAVDQKITVRTNTVVNRLNFQYVENIAGLLAALNVPTANFILFNPVVDARLVTSDVGVRYSETTPYLKNLLDHYENSFSRITIRYVPLCLMPGYERFIVNFPQIQYDAFEWDYYLRTYFRGGYLLRLGALLLGACIYPSLARLLAIGKHNASRELVAWGLAYKNHVKSKACGGCAYNFICDGIWRGYAANNGKDELRPVSRGIISDPCFFMKANNRAKA
jgi:MoaA/NifB/PqqE/SkfB family radical SAM enzyme